MKIQLRTLRVVKCGPLDDVCIDFCDSSGKPQPITVIGGANGTGKTTIIELIEALADLLPTEPIARTLRGRVIEQHSNYALLERTQYACLEMEVDQKRVAIVIGEIQNESLPSDYLRLMLSKSKDFNRSVSGDLLEEMGRYRRNQTEIAFPSLDVPYPDEVLPSILYFPHNRYLTSHHGSRVDRVETTYQWVYRYEPSKTFAGSLDAYLIWLDYAEPKIYEQVINFLNSLNFDGKTFGVVRKDLEATVTTRDGKTHPVSGLSSGEQNILILLLELRRRLLPNSIVLIDEIENSLHPAFQYRLAQLLKRMQEVIPFQLIVTTHAPAFVEIFGSGSVRILTEF